jgi:hypothetical protein
MSFTSSVGWSSKKMHGVHHLRNNLTTSIDESLRGTEQRNFLVDVYGTVHEEVKPSKN